MPRRKLCHPALARGHGGIDCVSPAPPRTDAGQIPMVVAIGSISHKRIMIGREQHLAQLKQVDRLAEDEREAFRVDEDIVWRLVWARTGVIYIPVIERPRHVPGLLM